MTDLSAILSKLEAAQEGSRELSDAFLLAIGWERRPDYVCEWIRPDGTISNAAVLPDPTRNLQHAVDAVPEGLYGKIGFGPNRANARIWLVTKPAVNASIQKPQPALALCIAILKAMKAMNDE